MNKIITALAASAVAASTIALASPAQAGSGEIFFVQTATQSAWLELDWDTKEFACDWFQYDRRDMYRESWREIWAGEGVTYRDMRIGIYRAMKNVCY